MRDMMDDRLPAPIGRRVAAFRELRGLTQSGLAARLHRSGSWVGRIERGERRIDSIAVVTELARALSVQVYELTGQSGAAYPGGGRDGAAMAELRRALDRPAMASPGGAALCTVSELQRAAATLRRRYHATPWSFSAVLSRLGDLVSEAQYAVATVPAADRPRAYGVLAELYQVAATGLRQSGDLVRARVAIDRAVTSSERSGDPLRLGAAASFLALQLWTQGSPADGLAVAMEVADLVARDPLAGTAAGTVVRGALHYYAAIAAARTGDEPEARHLLRIASRAAEALGRDREAYGMFFGPANLATQEVYVLVELGRPHESLRRAETARPKHLGSVVRSGIHYLGLARANSMCGRGDEALAALAAGLGIAPEVVGNDPWAREIVRDLLHRRRHAGEELRRVARDMKVIDQAED